jgi:RNA polymerase sigma-70 factor (ECF subfamily)
MEGSAPGPVTELLRRWKAGEDRCLDELLPLIDVELRRIAHRYMSAERSGCTLQTTALINEAWLTLIETDRSDWQNRAHFFAVAAQLMRHILVDRARQLSSGKRGAGTAHLPFDETLVFPPAKSAALLALDQALNELATFDVRKAKVVELRYFGGMSVKEAAEALNLHPNTIIRDWTLAKIWLKREMARGAGAL